MTRRALLQSIPTAAAAQSSRAARPNVVLFYIDDLGWKDVGFQGGEIPTPHIDSIAREGVRFTHYYTYPLCTPSRCGLMTGRSPARQGLIYSVIRPWSPYGVPLNEYLLPQAFREAGYQTACIGKWHLGHAHQAQLPHRRGFDLFYGHVNAEIDYFTHTKLGGLDWQRNGKGVREPGYATDLLGAEAVRWLAARDRTRPFFLYLPFNAVHSPMQAPEERLKKFAAIANPQRRALAAMLDALDESIGKVLAEIERQGAARETLVIFCSDNGGPPRVSVNAPLRAGKLTCYEGGLRVPMAMRWPGVLPAGGAVEHRATVLDLFPTLCAAAGVERTRGLPLDGQSLWGAITRGERVEHEALFFACKRNETLDYQYAVIRGSWKLVATQSPEKTVRELFDIAADPYEKQDLAGARPEIAAELTKELERWRGLHPKADIQSSMEPHPGWVPPADYAEAAPDYRIDEGGRSGAA